MPSIKRTARVTKDCVACGCCVNACPLKAIAIHKGLRAVVGSACVGCGKCAKICPADVIELVEVDTYEKAVV